MIFAGNGWLDLVVALALVAMGMVLGVVASARKGSTTVHPVVDPPTS